jgi:hypothetical protein
MTKQAVIKRLELEGATFDWALPQNWVNEVAHYLPERLKNEIGGNFVWLYDEGARMFGRPCSISFDGNEILSYVLTRPNLFMGARMFKEEEVSKDDKEGL